MMIWSQPAASASSTPYWMMGLSTRGSISLGWALVAGRKRVPSPAAGKTALRTLIGIKVSSLILRYVRWEGQPPAQGVGAEQPTATTITGNPACCEATIFPSPEAQTWLASFLPG